MVRIGAIRWLPVPSGPGDWPLSFLAVALRSEVGPRKRVVSSLSAWRIAGAVSVFTFLSSLSGVANATLESRRRWTGGPFDQTFDDVGKPHGGADLGLPDDPLIERKRDAAV